MQEYTFIDCRNAGIQFIDYLNTNVIKQEYMFIDYLHTYMISWEDTFLKENTFIGYLNTYMINTFYNH